MAYDHFQQLKTFYVYSGCKSKYRNIAKSQGGGVPCTIPTPCAKWECEFASLPIKGTVN